MADLGNNGTLNSSKTETCMFGPAYLVFLSLTDIITVLIGQPVITKLLWITFTSKKTLDILNCNLALFHNIQYFMSFLHIFILFMLPNNQTVLLRFLLVYAEIGGPTSLAFICTERYVAVIHPTSYPLLKKYRFREVCAVTVWLISVPSAFVKVFAKEPPSSLQNFPVYILVFMTVVMMWCSVNIGRTLKKSSPGRDELHPVKKRAFKTVCATATMAFFCYIPVTLLERFLNVDVYILDCIVTPGCILLLSAASVVHPMFYVSTQGKLFICLKPK